MTPVVLEIEEAADLLRRAAALMRERAAPMLSGAPWEDRKGQVWRGPHVRTANTIPIASGMGMLASAHIASWHPAVALSVADLFANLADHWEQVGPLSRAGLLAVATAYLGSDQ